MSNIFYKTIFDYDGRQCIVKTEDIILVLPSLPAVETLPRHTNAVRYYPELRDEQLRESAAEFRDMRPPEIEAIKQLLLRVAEFGRSLRRT